MELLANTLELKQLGRLFREQRLRQGLSQAAAAQKVGAKQSQISGFESGRAVLAEDKVRKLAGYLEVNLDELRIGSASPATAVRTVLGYCSVVECPGNLPYFIQGRTYIKPMLVHSPADGSGRCRLCGDAIVVRCVHCDAPIGQGLHCGVCGEAYVQAPEEWADHDEASMQRMCETIRMEKSELTRIVSAV